jgi:hypothetical protein
LPEGYAHDTLPDMPALLEAGYKKGKLRGHSDYYPNQLVNDWALSFLPYTDIMCESKCKNLASIDLYKYKEELEHYELFKQNVQPQSKSFVTDCV